LKAEILEEIIKYLEGFKSLKGDAKVCSGDREFLWYTVF
jgi:hypothetical protein